MPIDSFNKLAEEAGDPKCLSVTIIGMTGRCGSTLIGQMMSRVPNVSPS